MDIQAKCPCLEKGKDGTVQHNELLNGFLEMGGANVFIKSRVCENHFENYVVEGNNTARRSGIYSATDPPFYVFVSEADTLSRVSESDEKSA